MYLLFFPAANRRVRAGLLTSLTGVLPDDWASWEEGEEPRIGLGFAVPTYFMWRRFLGVFRCGFLGWGDYSRCEMEVGRIVNIFTI